MTDKVRVALTVNGKKVSVESYPVSRLLDVLREELRLTGSKEGCGEGECGACSVMLNGRLVNSCLVPITQCEGTEVLTIEGVAEDAKLRKIQEAFLHHGGAQCGICTPGMVMASINILNKFPKPTYDQIREGLAGNLCRCTGYMKIFDSVAEAAVALEGK